MDGATVFFDALIEPLARVCPVTMDGVPGNHAYLRWAHRKTNLDAFFYGVLEQKIKERRLRTVRSAFFQRTRQDALELKLAECGQVRCLIGHGHFLRSPSFPIVAITRRLSAWMAIFRKFQVVAFGHYHRCGLIWIAPDPPPFGLDGDFSEVSGRRLRTLPSLRVDLDCARDFAGSERLPFGARRVFLDALRVTGRSQMGCLGDERAARADGALPARTRLSQSAVSGTPLAK